MKMKTINLAIAASFLIGTMGIAAPEKTYQVTGPILEINDAMIAVEKEKGKNERWEIARDPGTKSDSTMKVGDKVTITYTMTATKIELKADKAAQAEEKSSSSPTASSDKK